MQSPVKSCTVDPVVREFVDLLLPYLTMLVNRSLTQDHRPVSQKHAIVTPRLKKIGPRSTEITDLRLVSKLSFMSKVTEREVAARLKDTVFDWVLSFVTGRTQQVRVTVVVCRRCSAYCSACHRSRCSALSSMFSTLLS